MGRVPGGISQRTDIAGPGMTSRCQSLRSVGRTIQCAEDRRVSQMACVRRIRIDIRCRKTIRPTFCWVFRHTVFAGGGRIGCNDTIQSLLLKVGEQRVVKAVRSPRHPVARTAFDRRKISVGIVIGMERQAQLFEVIGALHTPCGFASGLNGGQKKGDQNSDDRDDDKKFDKSEAIR